MRELNSTEKIAAIVSLCLIVSCVVLKISVARLPAQKSFEPERFSTGGPMPGIPRVVLWAWERPERLDFIDPRKVAVAFLAKTLYLRGDSVIIRPRLQPLSVPPGTALIAVVRIESDRFRLPRLSSDQLTQTVAALAEASRAPGINALQIDFDAKMSERSFYRSLILDLRRRIPPSTALSITALASWCADDDWLQGLPIDEAVPMLFRLGVNQSQISSYLGEGAAFRTSVCRDSSGVSTDEPLPQSLPPSVRRIYVFNPRAWSQTAAQSVMERYEYVQTDP